MTEPNADGEHAAARAMKRRWMAIFVAVVVLVVAIVLIVLLVSDGHRTGSQATSDTSEASEVTSPYDFSELPEDSGPPDVKTASYVSILLADKAGQPTAYGLDSGMPAADALKQAVLQASEVDSSVVSSLTTVAPTASADTAELRSTLTFVFADRGKLTFDLYVAQGIIARGDRAWRVGGDLAGLIEAAVAAGQQ